MTSKPHKISDNEYACAVWMKLTKSNAQLGLVQIRTEV